MAYKRYGLAGQIIPFWKREIESLPKWQKGDPQIRMFLPSFWMKMVKPPTDTPNNQVHFVTHPQMTKYDIKHYLEKIYKVPVAYVTTEVKLSVNRNPHQISSEAVAEPDIYFHPVRDKMRQTTKWSEEYKLARVTLGEGQTFDYPNLESKIPNLVEKVQEGADKEDERIKEKVKNTAYVPNWFK